MSPACTRPSCADVTATPNPFSGVLASIVEEMHQQTHPSGSPCASLSMATVLKEYRTFPSETVAYGILSVDSHGLPDASQSQLTVHSVPMQPSASWARYWTPHSHERSTSYSSAKTSTVFLFCRKMTKCFGLLCTSSHRC